MLEAVPVWILSIGVAIGIAAFVQLGTLIAQRIARSQTAEGQTGEGIGAVVGALLGLLAFMLAFAFGMRLIDAAPEWGCFWTRSTR
jgi:hypothetical protein